MTGVVAAACWLNSSVQAQIIVTPSSIESVSSFFGNRSPVHLIDGSGLTVGPSGILGAADSTHGNVVDTTMWYSDPFPPASDYTPIVTFNLGAVFDVQTLRLWQFNQEGGFTVYGAYEVELSVSADNTNFTTLSPTLFPARAGGISGEPAQDFSTPATGVKYVRLQIWNTFAGGGNQASGLSEVRFIVNSNTAPPVITSQPQNQTSPFGGTATFTVTAIGPTPIGYQWRQNGTNLTDGVNISGATTTNLIVSGVSLASVGNYDVVLTNVNGASISAKAVLALAGPNITQQPQNWTNLVGLTASFTVAATDATGNPATLTFQWLKNGINLTNDVKISGVTTTNLIVSNVDTSDDGRYSVQITDNLGKVTVSRNALLTAATRPTVAVTLVSNPILDPSIQYCSSYFGPRPPERMVDGSGLVVGPSGILGAADSTHIASDSATEMWYSTDTSPVVIFNLGAAFNLQTTRIWQYNQSPYGFTGFGANHVEFAVSADNTVYTVLATNTLARAGGVNGEPAQDFTTIATGVQYVRLHILDSFAGPQWTGLSEVRIVAAGSKATISLSAGVVGLHYRVEYRSSLSPANPWQLLQDIPSLNSTSLLISDPAPVEAQRYYRAVLVL